MARLREKYPNALTLEREHQLLAEAMQQYKRIDLQNRHRDSYLPTFMVR